MKNKQKNTKTDSNTKTEITLTFDGNRVSGVWYHPGIAPILCALCKENCGKLKCHNVNPYCG